MLAASIARANVDRVGNVIDSDASELGGGVLFATLASFAVLHFYGEGLLFKLWGAGFGIVLVIGLFRQFVS